MTVADDYALPGEGQTPPADQSQQSGGQLRKQLEDALAVNKALQERITAQDAAARASTLTSLVKGAGLPEAAAARYPADAEVTPEKVTEWVNAEKAYAQQLIQPTPPDAPPGAPAQPIGVTPEAQAAAAKVAAAAAGASPPTEGLEGMYARLQDRSVPWTQLQEELAAMGFQNP